LGPKDTVLDANCNRSNSPEILSLGAAPGPPGGASAVGCTLWLRPSRQKKGAARVLLLGRRADEEDSQLGGVDVAARDHARNAAAAGGSG
jgi:hypothetical protein